MEHNCGGSNKPDSTRNGDEWSGWLNILEAEKSRFSVMWSVERNQGRILDV